MQYLKQSTAVTLKIGPFVDETNGKDAETGLTIAQADVRLSKNGGDIAQKTEATSCTHDELGIYGCPIDATDTNTLGRLQLFIHESGALPVWHEFMVIPANVYDSMFSTDKLEVDLLQIGGVAQSATDLKDFADAGYDPSAHRTQALIKSMDSGVLTAAAIATDAITAAKIAANAIGSSEFAQAAADKVRASVCVTGDPTNSIGKISYEIYTNRLTSTRAGYLDNLSAGAVALASICTEVRLAELAAANIPTDLDLALADTDELQADWANGGRLDLLVDRILEATEIKQASVNDASASTTAFVTNLTETDSDFWNRNALIFTSGNNKGQMRKIHTYNGTTKTITLYTALAHAPANSDTFVIVAARNFRTNIADNALIADNVWDELIADHVVAGTFGLKNQKVVPSETINDYKASISALALEATLTAMKGATFAEATDSLEAIRDRGDSAWITGGAGALTAAEIADAVWDELLSDHPTGGSSGEKLQGIKPRVPLSPWTKKELDKHFEIMEAIAKAVDVLPKIEKLTQLSEVTQSALRSLHTNLASLHQDFDQQAVSSEKLLDSRFKSVQNLQTDIEALSKGLVQLANSYDESAEHSAVQLSSLLTDSFSKLDSRFTDSFGKLDSDHSRRTEQLQKVIDAKKIDFSPILSELSTISKLFSSMSQSGEVREEEVKAVLQQLSVVLDEIENTPFDKFLKYLKAMTIASLPTETIRELINDEFKKPIKEILKDG